MDIVNITEKEIDVSKIIDSVKSESCGAISTFIGTTRDTFGDKKVHLLEYECYEAMAVKEIKRSICQPIRDKWPGVHSIALTHRLGEVPVKEISCMIAISSIHRSDSLKAVQFAIETLKATVPIWKKEIYKSGSPEWKENMEFTY